MFVPLTLFVCMRDLMCCYVCVRVCLSVSVCLSVCLSLYLSVCLYRSLPVCRTRQLAGRLVGWLARSLAGCFEECPDALMCKIYFCSDVCLPSFVYIPKSMNRFEYFSLTFPFLLSNARRSLTVLLYNGVNSFLYPF